MAATPPKRSLPANSQFLRLVAAYDDDGGQLGDLLAGYAYDGQGHRVSKTAGSVTTDYLYNADWQVVQENVSGQAAVRYLWDDRLEPAAIAGLVDSLLELVQPLLRRQHLATDIDALELDGHVRP